MFPTSVTQASTTLSDIADLGTCAAFDGINHILADTGVFPFKSDTSTWSVDKCRGVGVEAGVAARPATTECTVQCFVVVVLHNGSSSEIHAF